MDDLLIEYIRSVLSSNPVDIFSTEEDSVNHSCFELVDPRTFSESEYLDSRYIGSANMFIVASIICYEVTEGKGLGDIKDEDLDIFQNKMNDITEKLKKERFIREIQPVAHSKIKLVVDNLEPPDLGVQI